jgi:hypothetical protein
MTVTIGETKDRVASMVANFVGSVQLDADGALSFPYENMRVFVNVRAWGESSTVVVVFAVTNIELPPAPELYEFVALHTDDWMFGHLVMNVVDGQAMVGFSHSLLGDRLDPEELQAAVAAVAVASNEIGNTIKGQFGGKLPSEE